MQKKTGTLLQGPRLKAVYGVKIKPQVFYQANGHDFQIKNFLYRKFYSLIYVFSISIKCCKDAFNLYANHQFFPIEKNKLNWSW